MMKTLIVGSMCVLILATALGHMPVQAAGPCEERPTIVVDGESIIHVSPDRAVLCLGIETANRDIKTARQTNAEIIKKTIAVLRECGVADKDIQTEWLSLAPEERYAANQTLSQQVCQPPVANEAPDDDLEFANVPVQKGKAGLLRPDRRKAYTVYVVRCTMTATLNDVSKVEDTVARLIEAGVNRIDGLTFQNTKAAAYREQARETALKAARAKAEKMAAVLGETLARPVRIVENSSSGGWCSRAPLANVESDDPFGDAVPAAGGRGIAPGKLAIRASVNVTFALKP